MGVILPSVPPPDILAEYIEAAMHYADFVIFVEDGTYFGEIYGFQGVWANADTLEECRRELAEVLEGWILLGIELGHPIPNLPSASLIPRESIAYSQPSARLPPTSESADGEEHVGLRNIGSLGA